MGIFGCWSQIQGCRWDYGTHCREHHISELENAGIICRIIKGLERTFPVPDRLSSNVSTPPGFRSSVYGA